MKRVELCRRRLGTRGFFGNELPSHTDRMVAAWGMIRPAIGRDVPRGVTGADHERNLAGASLGEPANGQLCMLARRAIRLKDKNRHIGHPTETGRVHKPEGGRSLHDHDIVVIDRLIQDVGKSLAREELSRVRGRLPARYDREATNLARLRHVRQLMR